MRETLGIKHVALKVKNFDNCLKFYTDILGMDIDWQPDDNNVYLSNGKDNLALHKDSNLDLDSKNNRLDHYGIMLKTKNDVDYWFNFIKSHNIEIFKDIKDHRDGSRSFYCYDPDKNVLQIMWHPTLNK
ncbi:MAG: VOC family protein [Pelagibacterales bacterium]|jgi:catechol-2,3-dioxygenase|nr:VOC family protein [Pelagibacterales bacterium]|tara:strand:- start:18021 stop:18407 length:387 start_codon:yes stop_codon:yes gene_type:complete